MTSIQQQAAELAEEWKNSDCSDLRELERNGDKMAALLRQIASMGVDVEPVAEIVLQDIGAPFRAMQVRAHFFSTPLTPGGKLFTQQAIDAARLDGFEAGRRNGMEEISSWIATQRNDIPACGFEFSAAIRAMIEKEA